MTEQEAIDTLRLMMGLRVPEETKAIGMAIKALEKNIPETPAVYFGTYKYCCPTCGASFVDAYRDYWERGCIYLRRCPKCGQRIDWSEVVGEEK